MSDNQFLGILAAIFYVGHASARTDNGSLLCVIALGITSCLVVYKNDVNRKKDDGGK